MNFVLSEKVADIVLAFRRLEKPLADECTIDVRGLLYDGLFILLTHPGPYFSIDSVDSRDLCFDFLVDYGRLRSSWHVYFDWLIYCGIEFVIKRSFSNHLDPWGALTGLLWLANFVI